MIIVQTSAASCLVLMSSWRRNGERVDICPNFRKRKEKKNVPSLVLPAGPLQALTPGMRSGSRTHEPEGPESSILGLDTMLRKASVARVDRRLRRYYLIVRLLPNVFALACRSLGSIWYDTGSSQDGKTPFSWLHPCRLVTDSRRYLIVGASAATPLHSSIYFFPKQPCLND